MLNKFALVLLILQLARAERHAAAQSGPRGPATGSADEDCAVEGCATCVDNNAQECKTCKDGYNLNPTTKKCAKQCEVEGCATCVDNNAQECKTCKDGYNLTPTKKCEPSSTNKSSLSTGAIAGISVAAVVVVGGLVGFLCWWFLCRGKA